MVRPVKTPDSCLHFALCSWSVLNPGKKGVWTSEYLSPRECYGRRDPFLFDGGVLGFFFFCLFADVFHSGSAYFVSLGVRTKRVCILEMPSITPVYGGGGDG